MAAKAGTAGLTAGLPSFVKRCAKAEMSSFKSSLAQWTSAADKSAGRRALEACSRILRAASAISAIKLEKVIEYSRLHLTFTYSA